MKTRPLTTEEIAALERHGCRAEDWSMVAVAGNFDPGRLREVDFSGKVELGRFAASLDDGDGFQVPAGVRRARLRDVRLGDDCLVADATLDGVDVDGGAVLRGVACLRRRGDSPFANNAPAHVLAEDGARAVPLWRRLSAQIAHLVCHWKNHPAGKCLEAMIGRDAESLRGGRCRVGRGAVVLRAGELENVWIGEGALLRGVSRLRTCHIESSAAAPAVLGEGVDAEECVFLGGSRVDGGCRLVHSLVGEGAVLEHGFFAKHSLFFANTRFDLGEAACAMAGPYATSGHRATLVLACECSFITFGSASNSSNHHFKLGPRHGGMLRRGTRCGSGSYIFWPSDIGAFSTVVGRHSGHLDTADFPFSLILADGKGSTLVPGASVFTIGLYRDSLKWPSRDRRKGIATPLDIVNTAIFSPYTMEAVDRGMALLQAHGDPERDLVHKGATIPAARVRTALHSYGMAMVFYLGERLLHAVLKRNGGPWNAESVLAVLSAPNSGEATGDWRDWNGLLLSGRDADTVIHGLAGGTLDSPDAIHHRLATLHAGYGKNELDWVVARWRREYGEPARHSLKTFAREWREAVEFRHAAIVRDMGKEFGEELAYGFGIETNAAATFRRVRGEMHNHPLFAVIEAERRRFLDMADLLTGDAGRAERI